MIYGYVNKKTTMNCKKYVQGVLFSIITNRIKGAKMNLQLQQLRKAAGYKSRGKFAETLGISERKLKAWESQETRITFEDACLIADVLHCSLDELAGRTAYVGSYSDSRQAQVNDDYARLSESKKDAAADTVRGMLLGEQRRENLEKNETNGVSGNPGRNAAIA